MTHIKTAVIVLITAMILSLVITYASIMSVIRQTKGNAERMLDSFVIENSTLIYSSIKNGNDFTEYINSYDFINKFYLDCTLDNDGMFLYNKDDKGKLIYKLSNPDVSYTINNSLNLTCTLNVYFPMEFAGKKFTDLIIPIKVKTTYNLR